jgi:hypothetical protein
MSAQSSTIVNPDSPSSDVDVKMLYEHQAIAPEADLQENLQLKEQAVAPPMTVSSHEQISAPVVQTPAFSELYQQAGIRPPAHGFTILKIADMVSSNYLRELSREGKRAAILMALEASNVQIQDVIEDGARRDLALNEYEAHQQKVFQDFKARKQQQNQEIQAEIERLIATCKATIQANEKDVNDEKTRLDEWRAKKREEERRMRSAASHFVPNGAANADPASAESEPASATQQRPPSEAQPAAQVNGKMNGAQPPAAKAGDKRLSLWKR